MEDERDTSFILLKLEQTALSKKIPLSIWVPWFPVLAKHEA